MDNPISRSFSAPIVYVVPPLWELERRFPDCFDVMLGLCDVYTICKCKNVSMENREVAFEYVHLDHKMLTNQVLTEMDSSASSRSTPTSRRSTRSSLSAPCFGKGIAPSSWVVVAGVSNCTLS